jgi:hypothetical protein
MGTFFSAIGIRFSWATKEESRKKVNRKHFDHVETLAQELTPAMIKNSRRQSTSVKRDLRLWDIG